MPRFTDYDRPQTANRDPAAAIGLARKQMQAIADPFYQGIENDLREQQFELQQVKEDRRLAEQSIALDRDRRVEAEVTGAIASLTELDPTSPDYPAQKRIIGQKYPHAFTQPHVLSIQQQNDAAHRGHVDRLREEFGVGEDVNPLEYAVRDPQTGEIDYEPLKAIGASKSKARLAEANALRTEQFKSQLESMGESFDSYQPMLDSRGLVNFRPKSESALTPRLDPKQKAKFDAANSRRTKALALFVTGFKTPEQAQIAKRELEAANSEYGAAHKGLFGEDWQDGGAISPAAPEAAPAAAKAPASFDTEAAARAAGHKKGDIVILINPKTNKPGRARLE